MDRQHLLALKGARKHAGHDQPVLEHVGDAARRADVVLEHQELAGRGIADQVDAGDMRVDAARHVDADHLAPEVAARQDQRAGHDAVLEDPLRAVDVLQEQIQRDHALREPALDAIPFRPRHDARHQVEGEQPLGAEAVVVDGEGDALKQKRQVGQAPALLELRRPHLRQLVEEGHAVRPRLAVARRTSRRRRLRDRSRRASRQPSLWMAPCSLDRASAASRPGGMIVRDSARGRQRFFTGGRRSAGNRRRAAGARRGFSKNNAKAELVGRPFFLAISAAATARRLAPIDIIVHAFLNSDRNVSRRSGASARLRRRRRSRHRRRTDNRVAVIDDRVARPARRRSRPTRAARAIGRTPIAIRPVRR